MGVPQDPGPHYNSQGPDGHLMELEDSEATG